MKRLVAIAFLAGATGLPALAAEELQTRDLPPVTRMDAPEHPAVEIVRDRRPRAVVYVADTDPSSTLKRLVDELVEVVRLSTGATLERIDQPPAADRPAIVIGDCDESRRAGIDAEQIPVEGFVVKTAPNRVYLVGSTKALPPGSTPWARWSNEGTAWAVADFLERFVDVRWYWPTELGGRTVTPSTSLIVPPVHYRDQPVFRLREYHPRFGWKLPAKACSSDPEPPPFPSGAIPEGVETVDMATYLPLIRSGCSWPYKIKVHEPQNLGRWPKEFHEEHKEMFAVNKDGTRNYNFLCYSSPKTLDFLLDGCRRVWDEGGGATWVTSACVTVSPADSPVGCHCPVCQKTFAEGGGTRIGGTALIMSKFAQRMTPTVGCG